ncbi:ARM repeat superfamily protein [Rhynchospora pubera]|uniref:ARM repeat superfamily protein n=1 Tax=Rhynchospora pubera TaxID=906938 RepID=A0AAV8BT81_9POAL|nr:ARM repeat superfamily protein [Rhynchospora pubera]
MEEETEWEREIAHKEEKRKPQEKMEKAEEIRPENDDSLMNNSMQPKLSSDEILLTIPANIIEEEREVHVPHSSTENSMSLSRASIIFDTIEHPDDWGAINSGQSDRSGVLRRGSYIYPWPEKELTNFALRIVIMEKAASGIGLLTFIWATVVLLGGFASTLKTIDFVFITIIIFMVGTGIFNRNHKLDSRFFFQATKAISSTIGKNLTILQFSFAIICITFSVMRLVEHIYGEDLYTTNMKVALYIFYVMALVHAALFLLKKAYWFWRVSYHKIIHNVSGEFGFGVSGVLLVQRFFYETYWQLSKGSVFSALDLDIIAFAQGLLASNSHKDQLIAVRILNNTISHEKYSEETRRRLETSIETIGRLFNMLTWKYQEDSTIRIIAAKIVERLASDLLVKHIPGGMDCIHSLLTVNPEDLNENIAKLNLIGLNILKRLAGNPKNCWMIKETRGLLSMIIVFTKYKDDRIHSPYNLKLVKRSLILLTKITSTKGKTGKILRRHVSDIASTVSNLRDILINEGTKQKLLILAVETLTALSVDTDGRKKIGRTSGVIKVLLSIFLQLSHTNYKCKLRVRAGGLLAILVLQNKRNCSELFDLEGVVEKLIKILHVVNSDVRIQSWDENELYKIMAMRILRNLCAYAGRKWHDKLKEVVDALPWVLGAILSTKNYDELLEACTELCVQICKFTSIKEYDEIIRNAGYSMIDVAKMLLNILKENKAPNNLIPRLRRSAIELAIWMMESYDPFISYFKAGELGDVLTQVAETTSDFENFQLFSGDIGLAKHPKTISSLLLKAKQLLA